MTAAQARLAKDKSDAKDTEAVKTAQAKVKEAQDALDQAKTILAKAQADLKQAQKATVEAAAKADKVMASTGADTNGVILAVVAFAGMGAATLDLKRRRMDVTARHGMR